MNFQQNGDEFIIIRIHKTDSARGGYSANWVASKITKIAKTPQDALLYLLEEIKLKIINE